LKPGEISPVISAEEGFLIFTVTERRPARVLTAEEAEPEIRERIAREKAESYLQGLVEAARRENRLRVFADRLPFVYTGSLLSGPPAGAP
jgi:parvulin-like peptidyl-prolyl isomerase